MNACTCHHLTIADFRHCLAESRQDARPQRNALDQAKWLFEHDFPFASAATLRTAMDQWGREEAVRSREDRKTSKVPFAKVTLGLRKKGTLSNADFYLLMKVYRYLGRVIHGREYCQNELRQSIDDVAQIIGRASS